MKSRFFISFLLMTLGASFFYSAAQRPASLVIDNKSRSDMYVNKLAQRRSKNLITDDMRTVSTPSKDFGVFIPSNKSFKFLVKMDSSYRLTLEFAVKSMTGKISGWKKYDMLLKTAQGEPGQELVCGLKFNKRELSDNGKISAKAINVKNCSLSRVKEIIEGSIY